MTKAFQMQAVGKGGVSHGAGQEEKHLVQPVGCLERILACASGRFPGRWVRINGLINALGQLRRYKPLLVAGLEERRVDLLDDSLPAA